MNYYDCPDCDGKHPWLPGTQPCPTPRALKAYDTSVSPTGSSFAKPPKPNMAPIEVTDSLRKSLNVQTAVGTSLKPAKKLVEKSAPTVAGSSERAEKYREYMRNYMKEYRQGMRRK